VGIVAGLGELLGYALRLVSGYFGDRTGNYWAITIAGYIVNLVAVPLLAFAGSWEIAALLMIMERTGKAIRSPVRDAMLSHATHQTGRGWGFGLHEAMDQTGALLGPLAVAWALSRKMGYPPIFAMLAVPAVLSITSIVIARSQFPRPHDLEKKGVQIVTKGYPKAYWVYLAGASLIAAGYVDFPLIAFHFKRVSTFSETWIPLFYAFAMIMEAASALLFGRLFDRIGFKALIGILLVTSFFAPFVFTGSLPMIFFGMALWGAGMGAHDSVMRAVIADWIPSERRGSAYGLFNAVYGVAWFAGSALVGFLYDRSELALIAFSIIAQLLAMPLLYGTYRLLKPARLQTQ
jgi:MFS family permease